MKPIGRVESKQAEVNPTKRYQAVWNGAIIAESADTLVVEGNHYFPIADVRRENLRPSASHTTCHWKGVASYYDLVVGDQENPYAAWYYPEPRPAAARVHDSVTFWIGVRRPPAAPD